MYSSFDLFLVSSSRQLFSFARLFVPINCRIFSPNVRTMSTKPPADNESNKEGQQKSNDSLARDGNCEDGNMNKGEKPKKEFGGPAGPEPTRYGDWERKGRVSDF
ncbi:hypothetical protein niasHT_035454 [Heterodera trifolii]|uniref:Succinate dehydrogenase assembly factor 4, mitochondrial n=1 Tax=Heterodera trifolii TaxID=157864 RepID=A0ABD2IAJ7_9BILA